MASIVAGDAETAVTAMLDRVKDRPKPRLRASVNFQEILKRLRQGGSVVEPSHVSKATQALAARLGEGSGCALGVRMTEVHDRLLRGDRPGASVRLAALAAPSASFDDRCPFGTAAALAVHKYVLLGEALQPGQADFMDAVRAMIHLQGTPLPGLRDSFADLAIRLRGSLSERGAVDILADAARESGDETLAARLSGREMP